MPRLRRWFRRGVILALVAPFGMWFGAAFKAQRDYARERSEQTAQFRRNCEGDRAYGSVEECVAESMDDWTDSFPPPEWPW